MSSDHYVIITPVCDEAQYIEKTIASVTDQTVLPSRWIIVDDGSSDGTGEILDECATRFDWIQVVHRATRGFRAAGDSVVETFYAEYGALA